MTYRPPLRDLAAALGAAGYDRLAAVFPDADSETAAAILEAAGDFAAGVVAPLNRQGDLRGATYANGVVTAAPGFADAYRQFAA
ncbi:MAG TPA: acyl-CoA dehydrogenase, partial [Caulobacter sp.]|nr:acyl-CoA dehydrogenase [Caulobacter sp.]